MRKLIFIAAALVLCLFAALPCSAIDIFIDGEKAEYSENTGMPIAENGTVLLPLHYTSELFGAGVLTDNPYGTAVITRNGVTVSCSTGERTVYRNGTGIPSDYGLVWRNGPLYVDAAIFRHLGAQVYVGKESVIITHDRSQPYAAFEDSAGDGSVGLYAASFDKSYRGAKYFGAKYEPDTPGVYLGSNMPDSKENEERLSGALGCGMSAYRVYASCDEELRLSLEEITEKASDGVLIYCVIEEKSSGFGSAAENPEVYIEIAKSLEGTGANLLVDFAQNPNCENTLYKDAESFIKHYREVSGIFRAYAPSVGTVFSVCACCKDFERYYPGDSYADYIGISACTNINVSAPVSPLRLPESVLSCYSYKKPFIITSPLLPYAKSYASLTGTDRYALISSLYCYLPVKYPQIKAAFLFSEPAAELQDFNADPAYANACRAGIGSGTYLSGSNAENSGAAEPWSFELCDGATVPPSEISIRSSIDARPGSGIYAVYSVNGEQLMQEAKSPPYSAFIDFSPHAGETVLLSVSFYDAGSRVCAEKSLSLKVSTRYSADRQIEKPSAAKPAALAFLAIVSLAGIFVVVKKINDIFC